MRKLIIAAVCGCLGLTAAYISTADATGPVTLPDLPGLGYSLSLQGNGATGCYLYVVIAGNGVDREIPIGDIPPGCVSADEQRARIDALLVAYPPVPTSVAVSTVRETTTVTAPAVTVQAAPPPAVTVPVDRTVTVVETVTAPAAVAADPPWMVALAARSEAMNDVYGLA